MENNNYKIGMVIETRENTFSEYRFIFDKLSRLDILSNKYKFNDLNIRLKYHEKSKVININQGSIDILAFVSEHWFSMFLFILSIDDTPVERIIAKYKSFDKFVDSVEGRFKEITSDFPEVEIFILEKVFNWFKELSEEEIKQIKFSYNFIKSLVYRIKKIYKK